MLLQQDLTVMYCVCVCLCVRALLKMRLWVLFSVFSVTLNYNTLNDLSIQSVHSYNFVLVRVFEDVHLCAWVCFADACHWHWMFCSLAWESWVSCRVTANNVWTEKDVESHLALSFWGNLFCLISIHPNNFLWYKKNRKRFYEADHRKYEHIKMKCESLKPFRIVKDRP